MSRDITFALRSTFSFNSLKGIEVFIMHGMTVTHVFRHDRFVTSTFALMNELAGDFVGPLATKRLSTVLGVSRSTASRVIAGKTMPNLHRLAYYFGYMPEERSDSWRVLPMSEQPFDAGPALHWDDRLVEYLREVLGNPCGRPPIRLLAWRMDSTERRLRRVIRRHDIRLSEIEAIPNLTA